MAQAFCWNSLAICGIADRVGWDGVGGGSIHTQVGVLFYLMMVIAVRFVVINTANINDNIHVLHTWFACAIRL